MTPEEIEQVTSEYSLWRASLSSNNGAAMIECFGDLSAALYVGLLNEAARTMAQEVRAGVGLQYAMSCEAMFVGAWLARRKAGAK